MEYTSCLFLIYISSYQVLIPKFIYCGFKIKIKKLPINKQLGTMS